MPPWLAQQAQRAGRRLKRAVNAVAGVLVVALLRLLRRTNPDRIANLGARVMRRIGPWLPEHKVGRANLAAAFPDKTPAEIEQLLLEVWANLGRTGAEYPHLDRLWDFHVDNAVAGRVEILAATVARFYALRDDGKPALLFAAHLGNWEMPAVGGSSYDLPTGAVYRPPNIGDVAAEINRIRSVNMGELIPAGPDTALRVAAALERGLHIGMLVDQHFTRGVDVVFFGRTCKANPMIARLARHYECPIVGVRSIRLPNHRFRFELTAPIEPARDAEGKIDVQGTMQIITTVVENWVREHPEQWLWLHRRWR